MTAELYIQRTDEEEIDSFVLEVQINLDPSSRFEEHPFLVVLEPEDKAKVPGFVYAAPFHQGKPKKEFISLGSQREDLEYYGLVEDQTYLLTIREVDKENQIKRRSLPIKINCRYGQSVCHPFLHLPFSVSLSLSLSLSLFLSLSLSFSRSLSLSIYLSISISISISIYLPIYLSFYLAISLSARFPS